jgi:hypothetical protein
VPRGLGAVRDGGSWCGVGLAGSAASARRAGRDRRSRLTRAYRGLRVLHVAAQSGLSPNCDGPSRTTDAATCKRHVPAPERQGSVCRGVRVVWSLHVRGETTRISSSRSWCTTRIAGPSTNGRQANATSSRPRSLPSVPTDHARHPDQRPSGTPTQTRHPGARNSQAGPATSAPRRQSWAVRCPYSDLITS